MLTLCFAPNTCALAAHLALEQVGAQYATVRVDFASNEQRSAHYLQLNPKGRVPTLATDRGLLTETPAILQYICQTHPQANLAPLDDVFLLAQMNAFNAYLCSTVHVAHAHRVRGHRWADDPGAITAMKAKVPQSMAECFELIEREMLRGPWVMGEQFTVSDLYLFTIAQWLEGDGVDPTRFVKVAQHRRTVSEMPVVRKVIAAQGARTVPLAPL